jgi:hypothetical protein
VNEKEITSLIQGEIRVKADIVIVNILNQESRKIFASAPAVARQELQQWISKTQQGYLLSQEEVRKVDLTNMTALEVMESLERAAASHSAGSDGWQARALKKCAKATVAQWCHCTKEWAVTVMDRGAMEVPEAQTLMKFIPKEGSSGGYDQLRPIEVDNLGVKVVSGVVAKRLQQILGDKVGETQFGFVEGRVGVVAIAALDKHLEEGGGAILLDLKRAYTNVCAERMLAALTSWGYPQSFVGWAKALTNPRKVHIMHKKRIDREGFWAHRGLRQGNPLSPGLFNVFASIMATILKVVIGGQVIQFADDTLVLFPKITKGVVKAMQRALDIIEIVMALPLNRGKTRIIGNGAKHARHLGGHVVESVKYLGVMVPLQTNAEYVAEKVKKLERAGKMMKVWGIGPYLGSFVWNTFIISRVIYLATMGILGEAEVRQIEWVQREMAGVVWKGQGGRKHYVGRRLDVLGQSWEEGGLQMRVVRYQVEAMKGIWARAVWGTGWIPNSLTGLREWIEVRMLKTTTGWLEKVRGNPLVKCDDIYQMLLQDRDPPVEKEIGWSGIWRIVREMRMEDKEWAWKIYFDVLNTPEAIHRHTEVVVMKACHECEEVCVWGTTHVLQCSKYGEKIVTNAGTSGLWQWLRNATQVQVEAGQVRHEASMEVQAVKKKHE